MALLSIYEHSLTASHAQNEDVIIIVRNSTISTAIHCQNAQDFKVN